MNVCLSRSFLAGVILKDLKEFFIFLRLYKQFFTLVEMFWKLKIPPNG